MASSRKITITIALSLLVFITGCATTGSGDSRDPIENLNRAIFNFNDVLDKSVFKPVAKGYQVIVPEPLDRGITNFFGNLNDFVTTINDLLQFKFRQGGSDAVRVLVNSTLGIFGLFDVATGMGFDKHDEDFGQTLGYWGIGNGPYLMLPVLGPSTLRDTTGLLVDVSLFDPVYQIDHVPTRNSLIVVDAIDRRADLLGVSKVLERAALDKYDFIKESYLQKRSNEVKDAVQTYDFDDGAQAFLE